MAYKSRSTRLSEALGNIDPIVVDIQDIFDEVENWKSGMEGTNLENTYKYEQLEQACEGLEEIISELEDLKEKHTEIEFPGMF
jgi:hypothetical protein